MSNISLRKKVAELAHKKKDEDKIQNFLSILALIHYCIVGKDIFCKMSLVYSGFLKEIRKHSHTHTNPTVKYGARFHSNYGALILRMLCPHESSTVK